jgi:hypothetical protein
MCIIAGDPLVNKLHSLSSVHPEEDGLYTIGAIYSLVPR